MQLTRGSEQVESFKSWLWFVELKWESRQKVEQNLNNLAFEMAIGLR